MGGGSWLGVGILLVALSLRIGARRGEAEAIVAIGGCIIATSNVLRGV